MVLIAFLCNLVMEDGGNKFPLFRQFDGWGLVPFTSKLFSTCFAISSNFPENLVGKQNKI